MRRAVALGGMLSLVVVGGGAHADARPRAPLEPSAVVASNAQQPASTAAELRAADEAGQSARWIGTGTLVASMVVGSLLLQGDVRRVPALAPAGLSILGLGMIAGPSAGRMAYGEIGSTARWSLARIGVGAAGFAIGFLASDRRDGDLLAFGAGALLGGGAMLAVGVADIATTSSHVREAKLASWSVVALSQPGGAGLAVSGAF